MKKSIGEIKGLLLSNKQMKELTGGRPPQYCPTTCTRTYEGNSHTGICRAASPNPGDCYCEINGTGMGDGCN